MMIVFVIEEVSNQQQIKNRGQSLRGAGRSVFLVH